MVELNPTQSFVGLEALQSLDDPLMSRFMEGGRQVNQGRKTSHSHTLFDLLAIDSSYSCLILLHTPRLHNCPQNWVFLQLLISKGLGSSMQQEAYPALQEGILSQLIRTRVIRNAIVSYGKPSLKAAYHEIAALY